MIIDILTNPPTLSYPDFSNPFILHIDASGKGLGCALYQQINGELKVLGYGSRTLNKTEQQYHSSKLEFLGLKWAVTEHFRDYLLYAPVVEVYTDNNPLVYVLSSAKLNATGQRWVNQLADFNLNLHYKPGRSNIEADYFSRFPQDINRYTTLTSQEEINKLMNSVTETQEDSSTWLCSVNFINSLVNEEAQQNNHVTLREINIAKLQDADRDIKRVKAILKQQDINQKQQESQLVRRLLRERSKLSITDEDILVRSTLDNKQIVLPSSRHHLFFQELHANMAHLGADRVYHLAKERVYWPNMEKDIKKFINTKCQSLLQKKPHHVPRAPLGTITSSAPMNLIAIDFLKVDKCSGGYEYILVIVDHFTRYTQAYATRNKSGRTVAEKLFNDFILRFGIPDRILHDQGG